MNILISVARSIFQSGCHLFFPRGRRFHSRLVWRYLIPTIILVSLALNSAIATEFTDEDFKNHVVSLKKELPSGFHVVVQKPFVVIGNDRREVVRKWARGTVKWTVARIKKQYFKKDPKHIVDIWLFKDKSSYEKHCRSIVGYDPHTPYGFYSSTKRAIIMNISTGGGTLVHEIVHPFIESNFDDCPSWFNEGLASLYEQCRDKNGKIWGSTNWRLRGLQMELKAGTLPTFKQLCETSTREFYEGEKGDNYAHARYICYYLQEHELLGEFYHRFRSNARSDPTGYQTLVSVLGNPNMVEFETKWKNYCLALRFP